MTSIRNGTVPAGVSVKTFTNKEKTLVTGYAVYIPSVTRNAETAAERMKSLSPMTDTGISSMDNNGTNDAEFVDFGIKNGTKPKQGVSGSVSQEEDL